MGNAILRRRWLVMFGMWAFLLVPVIGQQRPPAEKLKVSGDHASFEWFFLPINAARDRDFWRRNGLEPELVPAAGSAQQLKQQVESGVQIGIINTAEVLLARAQGTRVKIVAGYVGETPAKIFVRADSKIASAKGLEGKKIGILAATHTSYRAVSYMNKRFGIRAEPVALGDLEHNVAALRARTVDAIYSSEGAALTLVDSGALRVLVALPDVYPRPYTGVVIWATDDLIERRPTTVRAFVNTVLQSVAYLKEHPEYATALYIERTKAPKNVASRAVAELLKFLAPRGGGSGQSLVSAVEGNWQFTKDSGAVPNGTELNVREAVDVRFLP